LIYENLFMVIFEDSYIAYSFKIYLQDHVLG
jgi:hypothetical protein